MPVLVVAGEGGRVEIWGVYVSDLALEGNLYCGTRREATQRSRSHGLKHITTLVFQFLFQRDLLSKDKYIFKVLEYEKGGLPCQWRGFLILCERSFLEVG